MADPVTDLLFWQQVVKDAERTVVCNPDMESRVKGILGRLGASGMKVIASPFCPEGSVYVLDENAINAKLRQSLLRSLREPLTPLTRFPRPGQGMSW